MESLVHREDDSPEGGAAREMIAVIHRLKLCRKHYLLQG